MPDGCTDYSVSDDGLTWTFNLKQDLMFSDGSAVTAEDRIDTFTRLKNTAESLYNSPAMPIVSMEAPDANTLVLVLDAPRAAFPSELALFSMSVQSKAHHDAYIANGGDPAAYQPLSTGAYMLKEWVKGEYVTLEKNPYYANTDKFSLAEITIKAVADDNARITMLQAGDADVAMDLPTSSTQTLAGADGITVQPFATAAARYLILNTLQDKLSDVRVRKALRAATNQQELIDMISFGYATAGASYLPMGDLYRIDITPDAYDVDAAKALLAEAGYPNGIELDMWVRAGNAEYEQISTILKEQWAKAGITLNLISMESGALFEREENMEHTIVIGRWSEDINDPIQLSDYFWDFPSTKGYYTGWDDKDLQAINKASQTEPDPVKRAEMYKQLQQARYDYCADMCLYYPQAIVAMSDNVQNFVLTPLSKLHLENTTILAD